ncbi:MULTISPECIES: SGNH/GDSL hydrolase family protein [unclassified Luteococcus]|uniref:SGNH/GDSL hydrolase family protein n=1 Tax=unclassified Luteococcus TaxID=2639923 RepID=UPI00313B029D
MGAWMGLLRPVAVRQGERSIGRLTELPLPDGPPHGLVSADGSGRERLGLVVLGDETALGVGGPPLDEGLPGLVSRELARREGRDVLWQVVGERDATVLGLHHRLLPQVSPATEVAVLMVGMHDLLARRSVREWRTELASSLDLLARVPRVLVCGCPPLHRAPLLGWPLTGLLEREAAALDAVSRELCDERGRDFVGLPDRDDSPASFASDGLHPGPDGYRQRAEAIIRAL